MVHLDKYGWPVELFVGRPVTNFIRIMLHSKSVISDAEWNRREATRNSVLSDQVGQGPSPAPDTGEQK